VLSIPHLVLYRDGVAVAKSGGARPKHAIVEALSLDEHAIAG
jgi:thioredoxin-like negative regulator of GroEL